MPIEHPASEGFWLRWVWVDPEGKWEFITAICVWFATVMLGASF